RPRTTGRGFLQQEARLHGQATPGISPCRRGWGRAGNGGPRRRTGTVRSRKRTPLPSRVRTTPCSPPRYRCKLSRTSRANPHGRGERPLAMILAVRLVPDGVLAAKAETRLQRIAYRPATGVRVQVHDPDERRHIYA